MELLSPSGYKHIVLYFIEMYRTCQIHIPAGIFNCSHASGSIGFI